VALLGRGERCDLELQDCSASEWLTAAAAAMGLGAVRGRLAMLMVWFRGTCKGGLITSSCPHIKLYLAVHDMVRSLLLLKHGCLRRTSLGIFRDAGHLCSSPGSRCKHTAVSRRSAMQTNTVFMSRTDVKNDSLLLDLYPLCATAVDVSQLPFVQQVVELSADGY